MDRTLRYTICSFTPDPSHSSISYDFAVFIAGETDAALVGVNLSAYGLRSTEPLSRHAFVRTIEIIADRVADACQNPDVRSGFDILDAVASASMSSFWYRQIQEKQTDKGTLQAGLEIFATAIGTNLSELRRQPRKKISERWCESPSQRYRITEKHLELAGAC